MEPIPMEWVHKIFNCLSIFYGEKWNGLFVRKYSESLHKTIWRSALHGLTYEEVRNGLILCKKNSLHNSSFPPHALEFYRYAKKISKPTLVKTLKKFDSVKTANPETAKTFISDIRKSLYGRIQSGNKLPTVP